MAEKQGVDFRFTATDGATAVFKQVKGSIESVQASYAKLTAVLVGGGAIAGFIASIRDVVKFQDEIGKSAQKIGTSTEALSALAYSGKLADVSFETLQQSMKKLSVNMLDTQAGTGEAKDAFKALGVAVTDASGNLLSNEKVLFDIADKFAAMEDGAGKTALAVRLFGRAGAEMIPLLNSGSKGLRENADEARRFGIIISTEAAKAAEQFNDNLTRMGEAARGAKIALGNELLPALNNIVQQLLIGRELAGGMAGALRLFMTTPTGDPVGRLNEITQKLEVLKQQKKDIEGSRANQSFLRGLPFIGTTGDLETLNNQIGKLEQQRAFLTKLAITQGDVDNFDPSRNGPPKVRAPKLPGPPGPDYTKQWDDLKRLFEDVQKVAAELGVTAVMPKVVGNDFETAKRALQDQKRLFEEGKKGVEEYVAAVADKSDALGHALFAPVAGTEKLGEIADKILDLVNPLRQATLEAERFNLAIGLKGVTQADVNFAKLDARIRALLQPAEDLFQAIQRQWEEGLLSNEKMEEAYKAAMEQMQGAKKETDELADASKDFAHSIGTAFEDAVLHGKKFKDMLKGLADDIARIALRVLVTKPLENALTTSLSSGLFGLGRTASSGVGAGYSGVGQELGYAMGTDYVPQTGRYLLHQGEAVIPAIENKGDWGGSPTIIQNVYNDSRSDVSSINHAMAVARVQAVAAFDDQRRRTTRRR